MLWINSHLRLQPAGPGVVVVVPRVVSHLGDAELEPLHLYSLKSRAEKKWVFVFGAGVSTKLFFVIFSKSCASSLVSQRSQHAKTVSESRRSELRSRESRMDDTQGGLNLQHEWKPVFFASLPFLFCEALGQTPPLLCYTASYLGPTPTYIGTNVYIARRIFSSEKKKQYLPTCVSRGRAPANRKL